MYKFTPYNFFELIHKSGSSLYNKHLEDKQMQLNRKLSAEDKAKKEANGANQKLENNLAMKMLGFSNTKDMDLIKQ